MLGRVIFRYLVVSAIAVAGVAGVGFSQEMPTVPSVPDESDITEGGEDVPSQHPVSLDLVWNTDEFSVLSWGNWEREINTWFDNLSLMDEMVIYPPSPPGSFFGIGQDLMELPQFLHSAMDSLQSIEVEGIKTWGVSVRELVSTTGTREFVTIVGRQVIHRQSVSSSFNPEEWSRQAYNRGEPLPEWIENDELMRQTWYLFRGRERIGMSFTFIEPGKMDDFREALRLKALAEREKVPPSELVTNRFAFTKIAFNTPGVVSFDFYNPQKVGLGLLTQAKLSDLWDYRGRIARSGDSEYVMFDFYQLPENDPRFFKMVDLTTDSDNDGLPDGLELSYFRTDPERRDSTNCGMDDWSKIYLYDLDPTVPDNDGDGILDGEDETPKSAGPEIIVVSPKEGDSISIPQGITMAQVGVLVRVVPTDNIALDSGPRKLKELWINNINKIDYKTSYNFESTAIFSETLQLAPGRHKLIVEATQEATPLLRSRKIVPFTVKTVTPILHIIEPQDGSKISQCNVVVKVRVESLDVDVYCNGHQMNKNGYYRYCILNFTEDKLGQEQTITLLAKEPNGSFTQKSIRLTMTQYIEREIELDHIMNTGARVFLAPIDGLSVSAADDNDSGDDVQ